MTKRMLIDAQHPEETRVVIADENQIFDFDFVSTAKKQLKGNIYLAKITRVEPSLQAAFVEYGGGKQGFLPFSEIHADYYQIPVSDRQRLMEEAAAMDNDDSRQDSAQDTAPQDNGAQEQTADVPEGFDAPISETAEQERPAYLTQGAIDISVSEHVDAPEDHVPFAQSIEEQQPASDVEQLAPVSDFAPEEAQSAEPANLEQAGGEYAPTEQTASEHQNNDHPVAENQTAEGVETLPNEEEEYRPKKNLFFKRYKIQEVIRRGQIVLVQVIKEERGNKGCSLTTYLSLAGRYCVLMPNSPKDGGISRKIANAEDRKRLKAISTELRLAQGMSVIVRTAGMDRTRAEIKRDFDYLVKLWNQIREDTLKSNAPALIYEESDIIKRAIRDQYTSDIDELIIEGDAGFDAAKEFMKLLLPSHTPKIKHYSEATPLFYAYNVEEQLLSMHDPVVKLRSGGYIVINPTEALISIDVNSGRATGERNIEETATKTNLEAAAEVARQLRLRDLAGLIVIDFIDMMESRNRRAVEKALKDALKADRAKIQLGRISPFGLLEMSRQRLRPSISESNMVQCPHCEGRGFIRSNESMSIQMIRAIEKEASAGIWSGLRLIVPQEVALHLLNTKRDILRAIEVRHHLSVQVLIGPDLATSEFNLEKMRRSQSDRGERSEQQEGRSEQRRDRDRGRDRNRDRDRDRDRGRDRNRDRDRDRNESHDIAANHASPIHEAAGNDNIELVTDHEGAPREEGFQGDGNNERGGRRRRRRGGRNRNRDRGDRGPRDDNNFRQSAPDADNAGQEAAEGDQQPADDFAAQPQGDQQPREGRPPRNRGGRGRRRWRDRDERGPRNNEQRGDAPTESATDGNNLPAFATEEPVMIQPERPREPEPVAHAAEAQQGGESSKKGWWQKMIQLDD